MLEHLIAVRSHKIVNNKDVTKTKPVLFSKYFGIKKQTLASMGVFNPILNCDTKLFVEPLLLKSSSSQIMQAAFEFYKSFFAELLVLLRSVKVMNASDIAWREAKRRVYFPEYKSTCIGYGSGTISGSGSGRELNDKILQTAKDIINLAEDNPDIFLLLPLLEEGIGADIISDMTQNIIDEYICEYTVDVLKKLGLEGTFRYRARNIRGDIIIFNLPYNKFHKCPIKLLPSDILSNLPLADKFEDWFVDQADVNPEVRAQVNKLIGVTWYDLKKSEKKEGFLNLIKKDKDFFVTVLRTLQNSTFDHYDLEKDYEGLYRWLEDSKKFIADTQLSSLGVSHKQIALQTVVEMITNNFKELIENKDLWRLFWTEHYSKLRHVREFYSQMIFFMVASNWLSAYGGNIDINRDFNKESKQLEFTFTMPGFKTIKVQVKHGNNYIGLKKAYEEQLEICCINQTQCYFLVLDFDAVRSPPLKSILEIENTICKIIAISASHQAPEVASDPVGFGSMVTQFEGLENEDHYLSEKRRGGANSYKKYKPLRDKVRELCKQELARREYSSARQLSHYVAKLIENDHKELLSDFTPYQNAKLGTDWTNGTFYDWCNEVYKEDKSIPIVAS